MEDSDSPLDQRAPDARAAASAAMCRATHAIEMSRALGRQQDALLETARAFMAEQRALRTSSHELLRDHVVRYTGALRAQGEPPERALVLMKAVIEPVLQGAPQDRRAVMETVVRWCVEAYYAA